MPDNYVYFGKIYKAAPGREYDAEHNCYTPLTSGSGFAFYAWPCDSNGHVPAKVMTAVVITQEWIADVVGARP